MRAARLVGLSQDGRSLIVATDTGEAAADEFLALDNDDRLRAALRGDRPRLGQLEIEMETVLSPREIQSRIRSGEGLEDVARVAGMPIDRVERFAAPVLAEREHVAALAMTSSVRRRGETSGHRPLRTVLQERLQGRGVDTDSVAWDAFRMADGRWGVTARYRSGETERSAEFLFDLGGRYSVAANDDARWVLGEHSSSRGPQPGRRRPAGAVDDEAFEPTLDLSDELALVRAVSEPAPAASVAYGRDDTDPDQPGSEDAELEDPELEELAPVHRLHAMPDGAEDGDPVQVKGAEADVPAEGSTVVASEVDAEAEFEAELARDNDETGGLDTLYAILQGDRASDAVAVPDDVVARDEAWEPSIVVDYPVEPQQEELFADPEPPALAEHFPEVQELPEELEEVEVEPEPEPRSESHVVQEPLVEPESQAEPDKEPEPEQKARPARRKRAAVPSWDEIMFGGPKKG